MDVSDPVLDLLDRHRLLLGNETTEAYRQESKLHFDRFCATVLDCPTYDCHLVPTNRNVSSTDVPELATGLAPADPCRDASFSVACLVC